jgi:hypothetical protein
MGVKVELDSQGPHRRGAERLHCGGFALLRHEQGRLLGGGDIAPVAQAALGGDKPGGTRDPVEQRGVDRLAGDHARNASRAAVSIPARISGVMAASADDREVRRGAVPGRGRLGRNRREGAGRDARGPKNQPAGGEWL